MKLKDKVALITGGAQGIGRQISLTFAREGADIVICDVNLEQAKQAEQEIKASGRQSQTEKMDVTDYTNVQNAVNKILDKFKKIDILVNNAGITQDNLILKMSETEWERVIKVNLTGTFNCTKAVSRVMLKQKAGKIINISSIIGLIGNIGQANYSASKAGIIALTKTTAKELASRNINVNAIAPGFIQTKMTERLPQEIRSKMLDQIPLRRFGNPEDVAGVCLFLASEEANYITGQTIIVDGGML
ncbi:MAG: 3-oxoacyl-[acyl-carrier-protein] reductase [Candidatus Omnitrophota bacterium]|jgi:3-oxoacyl-[acyl-carrier protein] reductase